MKRSVLLTTVALLIVAAVLAGLYLALPSPMAQRVKQLEGELGKLQAENARLKADYGKLQAAKKAEPPPAAVPRVRNSEAVGVGTAASGQPVASGEAREGLDPAQQARLRESMLKYRESQLDINYGRLFKQLGLNEQETERFKQLIMDRETKQSDAMMKITTPNLTKEQRSAVTKEMAAVKKESDEAIRHFLNNEEDNKTFQEWDGSKSERLQVQQSVVSFNAADMPLSREQQDRLVEVMVAARKSQAAAARQPVNPGVPGAAMQRVREMAQAQDQSVLQQAGVFLTPEQLGILEKMQMQRRDSYNQVIPAAPKK